ncbi:hypothetical protein V5799_024009 [Amblyomma americanum]|uniref:Uncharacterized protein n=1 Tax=Amblyomma americanum TaxID=6943 RepID=A0AAQ4DRV1_AMBAM
MMARMQRTAATIVQGTTGSLAADTGAPTRSSMFPDFVNAASGMAPRFFAGVDVIAQGNFVSDWLRRLRAWFALPALFQAHLADMVATEATSFGRYLEAPYYYEEGLAAYNYAVLGQASYASIAVKDRTMLCEL